MLSGDFRAVARVITLVENGAPEAASYLREFFPHTGRCFSIGITGAPGAGKSTLVDLLAEHYRKMDRRVGIIAIDPTSSFTGGAILGDRIRMQSRSLDSGTYIRSMATRGHLGGLAHATNDVLLVLDAAGFDVVLIETVGVGQDEIEIVRTAQATVVLLVPGMGDDIQTMKAGIMEIGDVFAINKADHPGVERIETELRALVMLVSRADHWTPLIVKTIASERVGVSQCAEAIEEYRRFLQTSQYRQNRSAQIEKERLIELLRTQILRRVLDAPGAEARLVDMAQRISDRKLDPYTAVEELLGSLTKNSGCASE